MFRKKEYQMRVLFVTVFVIILTQASFSQNNASTTNRIIQNLNRIESIYFKYLTFKEQQEAIKLLNDTRDLIMKNSPSIQNDLNLLNDESFSSLFESVKKEMADNSKTKLISAIGKNGKITSDQLSKLIALYTFDNYREELLRSIADNIIDPVNIGIVLKYFDSAIIREKLAEYFRNR
jgi:hypothetical protein